MNHRERQIVENLLNAVDEARKSLDKAVTTYATDMAEEEQRLRDEAVERMYRFEDWKDQYNSAQEDKRREGRR